MNPGYQPRRTPPTSHMRNFYLHFLFNNSFIEVWYYKKFTLLKCTIDFFLKNIHRVGETITIIYSRSSHNVKFCNFKQNDKKCVTKPVLLQANRYKEVKFLRRLISVVRKLGYLRTCCSSRTLLSPLKETPQPISSHFLFPLPSSHGNR